MTKKLILGTRGSELARAQARLVEQAIQAARADTGVETKIITTQGDHGRFVEGPAGRKGFFTAEIERALLAQDIDLAVHSAKDLPSEINPDTEIAAVLPRAPVDDALVSKYSGGLASLPHGAIVATGSVRRKCQLLWKREDFKVVNLRGNVPTRLRKLIENDWDAIVLARAGLERLGLSPAIDEISFKDRQFFVEILSREIFLPAGGQGTIAIQIRVNDQSAKTIADVVNDRETLLCLRAEREFLRLLQGDCNCPVGVLATIDGNKLKLRGQLFTDQSTRPGEGEVEGDCKEGERLAERLLHQLRP